MKTWYIPAAIAVLVVIIALPLALAGRTPIPSRTNNSDSMSDSSDNMDAGNGNMNIDNTNLSGQTGFYINPSDISVNPGEPIMFDVILQNQGHQVSGAKFRLIYDTDLLSNPQVEIASVFDGQINLNSPFIKDDFVEVALARGPGSSPYSDGQSVLATITFDTSSTASGIIQLTLDQIESQIFDIKTENVFQSGVGGTVTFTP